MNDKDLMKKLSTMTNEEIEKEAKELMNDGIPKELIKPLWEDEMLKEQIANTTDKDRERFRKSWDGIVKDLTLNTTDEDVEEFRKSLGVTDSWHIEAEIKETPAERKKRLMRLEKEMLVDMVFDLESRNEFLLHNLSEVEKMYNKLKEGEEIVKHGHLIDLPKAFDPSERPVKCSVCETVTSLYHGYEPKYCSNCGAKFNEEEEE